MVKIFKESYVYKVSVAFLGWVNKIFSESAIVNFFIKENDMSKVDTDTIFVRLVNKIIAFMQMIAHKIKLDKLFENSIFAKPIIWLTLTVFLTPFVPTMFVLAMAGCTALSLFLKICITKDFKLKYFKTNAWVLFFALVIAICAMTSISKAESRNIAMLLIAFLSFYFVIINTIENKKQFNFILYTFIVAGVISAVIGLYQYFFGDIYSQAWLDSSMFEDIKMRVYSTFENPNVYGAYLLLVVPLIFSMLWTEKGWKKKAFLLCCFGITAIALLLTFSRGCWLGIILGMGLLLIIIDRRFIILGVIALLLLPFVLPDSIMNRFLSIGNMNDSSTSYRVYIWLGTLAMLKDYWFSGIGLGETSFNTIYPMYSFSDVPAPHAHSLYLQIMVSYGIVGIIIFFGIMYNFYKETTIRMLKQKNIVIAGIIASISGFMLQSMFDYTWYNYRVFFIFWMVIALGIVATNILNEEE